MPLVKSEYACPTCEQQTGQHNQIYANAGELICSVNGQHKWNDATAFAAMNPKMIFKVALPTFEPQKDLTPFKLSIPIKVKEALEQRFAGKVDSTVAGILQQMVEGEIMIVPELDLVRIGGENGLGKKPRNSSELFGMIFALVQEVKEAKEIAKAAGEDLQAYKGFAPGRVVVNLAEQFEEAKSRAANSEPSLPLDMWCAEKLKAGIRDNWF